MQIVIDIPEKVYTYIQREWEEYDFDSVLNHVMNGVKKGTPLPKEHGDLKDAEKLKKAFIIWSMAVQGNFTDADIASIIYNSPTIIEADRKE